AKSSQQKAHAWRLPGQLIARVVRFGSVMRHDEFDDCMEMARALLGGYDGAGDLWEANEYINRALRLRANEPEAWILKSQILSSLDDDPAAQAAAEMAVRRAPRSAEAHYVRAAVLADLERYAEALKAVERAF